MELFWIIPILSIMALGIVALNSGFCRRGFSLTACFKSFLALFSSVTSFTILMPIFASLLGFSEFDVLSELTAALFSSLAVLILLGAAIEKLSFRGMLVGLLTWQFFVFLPIFLLSLPGGYLESIWGLKDFAGGLLVHGTSGASALGLACYKGRRLEFFNLRKSSHLGFFGLGAGLVFVGWLAFNSSGASSIEEKIYAMKTTLVAGSVGFLCWSLLDRLHPPNRNSMKGGVFGMISGLVAVTPGAGWISIELAFLAGVLGAGLAFYGAIFIEKALKIDDEMKVFASHFLPSWLGAFLVSYHFSRFGFASDLLLPLVTFFYCSTVTFFIFWTYGHLINICISQKQEKETPDILLLGEAFIET